MVKSHTGGSVRPIVREARLECSIFCRVCGKSVNSLLVPLPNDLVQG